MATEHMLEINPGYPLTYQGLRLGSEFLIHRIAIIKKPLFGCSGVNPMCYMHLRIHV